MSSSVFIKGYPVDIRYIIAACSTFLLIVTAWIGAAVSDQWNLPLFIQGIVFTLITIGSLVSFISEP